MSTEPIQLVQEDPAPAFRRGQLRTFCEAIKDQPNVWFVYRATSKSGVLPRYDGVKFVSRKQSDGSYKIHARYVGTNGSAAE
jgi:hypothetical protein